MDFINITAHDRHSNDSTSRTFNVKKGNLEENIEEWENSLIYERFTLSSTDYIEDYSSEVQDILEELDVEMI
jgi:hypothetical protein